MSSKCKVWIEQKDVRRNILQSPEMLAECKKAAQSRIDGNHHVKAFIGYDRAIAIGYKNTSKYNGENQ